MVDIDMRDNPSLAVNISGPITEGPTESITIHMTEGLTMTDVRDGGLFIGGQEHCVPIDTSMMPITIDGRMYVGKLVLSNDESIMTITEEVSGESVDMCVDGLDFDHGDLAICYCIGKLQRKL